MNNERPFVSRVSEQRYETAREAGEVTSVVVDGHVYLLEDLPRRLRQFHELRDSADALFRAAQRSMR